MTAERSASEHDPADGATAARDGTLEGVVGRERERATLAAALEQAASGRGGCVLLAGDAGIGKTTLVRAATAHLPAERVLWGRCHEASGAPAFWPWVQVLREYLRDRPLAELLPELGPGASDLARMVPALRERLPDVPAPPAMDPDEARFLLFDAVSGLLRRASQRAPLVIALEDLHWADRDSLLLLRHVAAELADTRALILATYREAEMRATPSGVRVLADLARLCTRLPLGGLDEAGVATLIATLTHATPAPELVEPLHRATGGNPFFVAEVVELLRAEGELDEPARVREQRFRIPDTVREAILRRLDPLPPATRHLLRVAAVLGRDADLAVAADVAGLSRDAALEALEPALELGLLAPIAERAGAYRFAHALLCRTLEDDLPPGERAQLHLRAGESLERLHALDLRPLLGEIANHFFAAASVGGRERAVEYAFRAGRRALDMLGFEEALAEFGRAVALLRGAGGDPQTLLRALLWLGIAQRRTGAELEARATLLEVARLARELGDAGTLARAALNAAAARAETGVADTEVIKLLEEALAALDERDTPLRANVMATLARCLYFTPERERREALSVEALEIARRTGDPSVLSAALVERHFVLWRPGTTQERLALATELVQVAQQHDDGDAECEARNWRILDLAELGRIADVEEEVARIALAAEHLRSAEHRWQAMLARAALALFAGRVDEAEALALQAMQIRRAVPTNNMQQFFAVQMFHIRRAQGRQAEVLPRTAETGRAATLPIWRCAVAQLHAELGDLTTARTLLDELAADDFALFPYDANYLPALAALAETAHLVGAREHARQLYERLAPHADLILVIALNAVIGGPLHRLLGLLALTTGAHDAAIAHLEAAIRRCEEIGAKLELARSRAALARALETRDGPGDAARASRLRALLAPATVEPGARTTTSVTTDATARATPPHASAAASASAKSAPAPASTSAAAAREGLLRREGDFWTLSCGNELARLKGTKGVEYLSVLLASPGQEVHALDLEGGERGASATSVRTGDAGEALDASARQAYRRRLRELEDAVAEAAAAGDAARARSFAAEAQAVERELKRGVGLGGRARRAGSDAERARVNVTRAIGSVLKKIEQSCPELGRHLSARVTTGTFCCYEPTPDDAILWRS